MLRKRLRENIKRTLLVRGGIEMDQNRLYYVTPYVKNFMCTVISCTQNKKGTWDACLLYTYAAGEHLRKEGPLSSFEDDGHQ